MLEVKTSWWNQPWRFFLVTLCGLAVTAQELKDAVFQSWGEVAKMRQWKDRKIGKLNAYNRVVDGMHCGV